MASRVVMPKLSDTMEEGKILRWLKHEGDTVQAGEALAEVETDKANVEMEAYGSGVLRKLLVPEGGSAPVGALIAVIGESGEDVSDMIGGEASQPQGTQPSSAIATTEGEAGGGTPGAPKQGGRPSPPKAAGPTPRPAEGRPRAVEAPGGRRAEAEPREAPQEEAPAGGRPMPAESAGEAGEEGEGRGLRASPLAARMAAEAGLSLSAITGSGPGGRIIKRDVEAAVGAAAATPPAEAAERAPRARAVPPRPVPAGEAPEPEAVEEVELSAVRRTIAKRMVQSKAPVPHFYLPTEVDMDRLTAIYESVRGSAELPMTLSDMITKAVAVALRRHPEINASFAGDRIRRFRDIHAPCGSWGRFPRACTGRCRPDTSRA